MKFSTLAERQIQKAKMEGQLENLEGEGKPLPNRPGEDAQAVGFRIMAEAGAVPREIQLRKEIDAQRLVVQASVGTSDYRTQIKKLSDLELRHSIEKEARIRFFQ